MSEQSQFWLSHLSAIEAEDITTKAYPEREGLSVKALYAWRKGVVSGTRRNRAIGGFVPVQVSRVAAAQADCTIVIDAHLRLECAALPG